MGNIFKKFFKGVLKFGFIAATIFIGVGTGGIGFLGGGGFWSAITKFGVKRIFFFAGAYTVLGIISDALTPRPRVAQAQQKLPIFTSATAAQRVIGIAEVSGVITHINEDHEDWLFVTYTIADHPLYNLIGVRIMGEYNELNIYYSGERIQRGRIAREIYPKGETWREWMYFTWNFTGRYNEDANSYAHIPHDFKGNGVSWVTVAIARRNQVIRKGFNLGGFRFRVASSEYAASAGGENPAAAVSEHLQEYFAIKPEQIDRETLDASIAVCDRTVGSPPQRANGRWVSGTEYEVLDQLLAAMDGVLVQSREKFYIYANPLSSDPPADVTITADMVLDEITINPLNTWDNLYNAAVCSYNDSQTGESISSAKFSFTSFVQEDRDGIGDFSAVNDLGHFQFINDSANAKRVAVQRTARARYGIQVVLSILEGTAPELRVWDKVFINVPDAGLFGDEEFRIVGMVYSLDGAINMILQKESSRNWYPELFSSDDIITPEISDPRIAGEKVVPKNPTAIAIDGTDNKGKGVVKTKPTTATITWALNPEAEYYVLYLRVWRVIGNKWADTSSLRRDVRVPGDVNTYTFTGLQPNVIYDVHVRAFTSTGAGSLLFEHSRLFQTGSTDSQETQRPPAPTNLRILNRGTTASGHPTVNLTWDETARTHYYYVVSDELPDSFGLHNPPRKIRVDSPPYELNTSDTENYYDIWVIAVNNVGESSRSNKLSRVWIPKWVLRQPAPNTNTPVQPRITELVAFQPERPRFREDPDEWNIRLSWTTHPNNSRYTVEFANEYIDEDKAGNLFGDIASGGYNVDPGTVSEPLGPIVAGLRQNRREKGLDRNRFVSGAGLSQGSVTWWGINPRYGASKWKFRVRSYVITGGNRANRYSPWTDYREFTLNFSDSGGTGGITRPDSTTPAPGPRSVTTPTRDSEIPIPSVTLNAGRFNDGTGNYRVGLRINYGKKTGYRFEYEISYFSGFFPTSGVATATTNDEPITLFSIRSRGFGTLIHNTIYFRARFTKSGKYGNWAEQSITYFPN